MLSAARNGNDSSIYVFLIILFFLNREREREEKARILDSIKS